MDAREELEFAISQYLDGDLSPADAAGLEERLAVDATARGLFRDHQLVNSVLRAAPTLPQVDWDSLLRDTSSRAAALRDLDHKRTSLWILGRAQTDADLISTSSKPYAARVLPWRFAAAASVLLALGGGVWIASHSRPAAPAAIVKVDGPKVETASGPVIASVSIGAAPAVASNTYRDTIDRLDRPSIVLIDRADKTPDSDALY